ncbi:MAG: membrane integrity-associated transporter subunit PqiC [Rhodobacteraceae bacterium]|nr:membrane integrity-associated transporter subunit PqiC [Paracoccaceae bacterium]
MVRLINSLCLALVLAACGDNSARYLIDTPAPAARIPVRVSTIEVLDAKLPAYASALEVPVQSEGGALQNLGGAIWGDDPVRAVTVALSRSLEETTTAKVAAEPWPLSTPAQAVLDLRVERMLARTDGQFELSGQYAIASPDGAVRERLERFDILVPLPSSDAAGISTAAGRAIAKLGEQIARTLAR